MCQSSAFSECVQDEVGSKNRCPECGLPAIMRNLQANRPIDALSECVQKLRPMKERHESLLASCSFSDEKEHIHPESKRRRIHPAKADSEIDSASRELHHVDVTEHTGCEIKASQEDAFSLTKSDKSHLSQQQEVDHHRRSNAESVKIIYTGVSESDDVRLGEGERHYCQSILNDDLSQEEINQALAKVGGTDFKIEIFQDADWIHEEVAHVIATVNSQRLCRRTQKYLDGIIKGKWIVGHQWLVDSISAGFWMNERYYEVKGDLTTGISFAARKGRELRANEVGVVLKSHSLVNAQVDPNLSILRVACLMGCASTFKENFSIFPLAMILCLWQDLQEHEYCSGGQREYKSVMRAQTQTSWMLIDRWLYWKRYQQNGKNLKSGSSITKWSLLSWILKTISRCSLQIPMP
ncbi:hypothetical protein BGW37DRAFT_469400 [Umbelopsis sp. PMI_123]|nr:hypothetical protein BGW37DRAFT_469400 [Umbelopsis sp. PMI_123]